jgi:hypothetical protein
MGFGGFTLHAQSRWDGILHSNVFIAVYSIQISTQKAHKSGIGRRRCSGSSRHTRPHAPLQLHINQALAAAATVSSAAAAAGAALPPPLAAAAAVAAAAAGTAAAAGSAAASSSSSDTCQHMHEKMHPKKHSVNSIAPRCTKQCTQKTYSQQHCSAMH